MDAYNQVNLESTDLDWERDMDAIDKLLDLGVVVHFQYAALMSGHRIVIVPATTVVGYGKGPIGIPERETERFGLLFIESWRNGGAWIGLDIIKTADWIEEKFKGSTFEKEPDSWALAYLLNSLVRARLRRLGQGAEGVDRYLQEIKEKLLARGEKIGAAATLH